MRPACSGMSGRRWCDERGPVGNTGGCPRCGERRIESCIDAGADRTCVDRGGRSAGHRGPRGSDAPGYGKHTDRNSRSGASRCFARDRPNWRSPPPTRQRAPRTVCAHMHGPIERGPPRSRRSWRRGTLGIRRYSGRTLETSRSNGRSGSVRCARCALIRCWRSLRAPGNPRAIADYSGWYDARVG
jgi:hypothetical protein